MDQLDTGKGFNLSQIDAERLQRPLEPFPCTVADLAPGLGTSDMKIALVRVLRTPTVDLHFNLFR